MSSRNPTEIKGEDRDPRFQEHHGRGKSRETRQWRRQRHEMFVAQGGLCWWCREKMSMEPLRITDNGNWKDNTKYATFEHLIPRSMGGKNSGNRVLAHAGCNNKRHKRHWPHDPIYGDRTAENICWGHERCWVAYTLNNPLMRFCIECHNTFELPGPKHDGDHQKSEGELPEVRPPVHGETHGEANEFRCVAEEREEDRCGT